MPKKRIEARLRRQTLVYGSFLRLADKRACCPSIFIAIPMCLILVSRFKKLVVFSGHMLDTAGRSVPRFPASKERSIRLAINKQLESIGAGIGFSSAACG